MSSDNPPGRPPTPSFTAKAAALEPFPRVTKDDIGEVVTELRKIRVVLEAILDVQKTP